MSASSVLLRGRAAAEALMVDTCTIRRVAGQVTDPETGVVTRTYSTVYSGKCKVQQQAGIARPERIAEAEVFVARLELHIPMSVIAVASDDLATITASVHDPDLVDREFHVRELAHKTLATARRYSIVEVTS